MKTILLPLIFLLTCLSGCAHVTGNGGAPQVLDAQSSHRLHQRDWDLKGLTVDGREIVIDVDTKITIRFAPGGQVGGLAGVNRFSGTYALGTDGRLNWGNAGFATTRKAGPPELMQKELVYMSGLGKTNVAILARHILMLQSDDASTVLTFSEAGY